MTHRVALTALALLLCSSMARAHYDSITWSDITIDAAGAVDYRLQVPLNDLSEALALESHRAATVAEVRERAEQLASYFLPKLKVSSSGQPCPLVQRGVDNVEAAELRAVLHLSATCPSAGEAITIEYDVFFDQDPRHLGVYVVHYPGGQLTGDFARERKVLTIPMGAAHPAHEPSSVRWVFIALGLGLCAYLWRWQRQATPQD